ncbi:MAG TPA: 16S rRNA (uracil(1498)-N(3))-methyltransferase [Candidatus Baltobacteraceae bacterium]|nr:16S rRNA (uracil(1498)-N(3))-methyltransferase [Candidatus Baltobacteraceae bacterium]
MRAAGAVVPIDGADARKITTVLRLRTGDTIRVVDSAGTLFEGALTVDGPTVAATLVRALPDDPGAAALEIDVAQAVPKGQKMDFVVEKATELGAGAILPFYSERSVVARLGEGKPERWRRLARGAAAQSGRRDVPHVADVLTFGELLTRFDGYDLVLFPWELAPAERLRDRLGALLAGRRRVLLVVGPEGGFSHDEAEAARDRGAVLLWLGRRILRTETAALALLAILRYAADD